MQNRGDRGDEQQDMAMIVNAILHSYLKGDVVELFELEFLSICQCPLDGCGEMSCKLDPATSLQLARIMKAFYIR